MATIHTPFLGGTGFGELVESGADRNLAPPYAPGAEIESSSEVSDEVTDWALDIVEEAQGEEMTPDPGMRVGPRPGALAEPPAPAPTSEAFTETAPEEAVAGAGATEGATEDDAAEEFPDFLFGGDAGESQEGAEEEIGPVPEPREESSGAADSGHTIESRFDPDTRERIRALAKELESGAAEDVIARAFEEGYRKAREEGQR